MDTASKNRYLHFYPRSPCGERLYCHCWHLLLQKISIHALLAESDPTTTHISTLMLYFYPRSPCGERQPRPTRPCKKCRFLSTLSLRRATVYSITGKYELNIFLSTLSLRRATTGSIGWAAMARHFYPRSPCGERHPKINVCYGDFNFYPRSPCGERQSRHTRTTHNDTNFYPRSPCGERLGAPVDKMPSSSISIHALLAESDAPWSARLAPGAYFYPRSPCGERLSRLDAEY